MHSWRRLALLAPAAFALAAPKAQIVRETSALDDVANALEVLQTNYFEAWQGTWPEAIDWTAAVLGTHVTGAISSLSSALSIDGPRDKERENLISLYFSQVLAFYWGQDHFSLRGQAYDDMLWVVLGWLEAVKFIDLHTHLYFPVETALGGPRGDSGPQAPLGGGASSKQSSDLANGKPYFGKSWVPAFAHRARVFWDLSSTGWGTHYCGGGMTWNPRLLMYKNAITNELWVAASASMYLYFPGDDNASPFSDGTESAGRDAKYLDAADAGHVWLHEVGMINGRGHHPEGLYVDGFHISGMSDPHNNNTVCDQRNDMVYTYNQGVMLTGLRGLWRAKGDESYIQEGHELIRSVVRAAGWDLTRDGPLDRIQDLKPGQLPPWRGMGRAGVLEDQCDVAGECSADSQSFKGIFFHHLTAFCFPLDADSNVRQDLAQMHVRDCRDYKSWVAHNAAAARATRDGKGRFGMWWTAGLLDITAAELRDLKRSGGSGFNQTDGSAVDYRTYGVPQTREWRESPAPEDLAADDQVKFAGRNGHGRDPNDRGRGRTAETQGGGLAIMRAHWEFSNL